MLEISHRCRLALRITSGRPSTLVELLVGGSSRDFIGCFEATLRLFCTDEIVHLCAQQHQSDHRQC